MSAVRCDSLNRSVVDVVTITLIDPDTGVVRGRSWWKRLRQSSGIAILPEIRFEARDRKPYSQPVTAKALEQGKVYFSVQFADDDMPIPIMETWVFAGRNLDPEDAHSANMIRWSSPPRVPGCRKLLRENA